MQSMGVRASDEEINTAIMSSPSFSSEGKFDNAKYASFIEKRLGRLGMTEKDLREIVHEKPLPQQNHRDRRWWLTRASPGSTGSTRGTNAGGFNFSCRFQP